MITYHERFRSSHLWRIRDIILDQEFINRAMKMLLNLRKMIENDAVKNQDTSAYGIFSLKMVLSTKISKLSIVGQDLWLQNFLPNLYKVISFVNSEASWCALLHHWTRSVLKIEKNVRRQLTKQYVCQLIKCAYERLNLGRDSKREKEVTE